VYLYYMNMPADSHTVRVNSAVQVFCAPDWHWDTRAHPLPDFDLWTVLEGRGRVESQTEAHVLEAGSVLVLRAGEGYHASHQAAKPLVVIAVHFDYWNRSGSRRRVRPAALPPLYRRVADLAFLRLLLERLLASYQRGARAEADLWLAAAMLEVETASAPPPPAGLARRHAEQINALCAEIRAHPERHYTVADLARRMHCTPQHLTRLFRRIQGQSPIAFVVEARIEAAKDLLRNTSYAIGRVADLLGYRDIYFFSKQFRACVGVAPSAYRR